MANHPSAKKRHRQNQKKRARNTIVRSYLRTTIKKVHSAVDAADSDGASLALRHAVATIDKAATKGVLKVETARRKVSRLNKKVNAMAAG